MVEFKACPRCTGDLKLTRDMYGDYRECLQCGYTKDIIPEPKTNFDWAKTARQAWTKAEDQGGRVALQPLPQELPTNTLRYASKRRSLLM